MEKSVMMKLQSPWYTYHKKVQALFKEDDKVNVRELADLGDGNYSFIILVSDKAKAEAIKAIINDKIEMGNVTVTVTVLGPDENGVNDIEADISTYETAFSGNSIFSKVVSASIMGMNLNYCIFTYDIIQFWNDDMSDYYGNFNGLAEDIARDVFKETGVMFCTEKL